MVVDIPGQKTGGRSAGLSARSPGTGLLESRARLFASRPFQTSTDPAAGLEQLLAWPTIASKNWVYRQYDHMVRDGSVVCPGIGRGGHAHQGRFAAGATRKTRTRAPCLEKYIAMTVDCNAAYVYLDPYEGAKIAVAEAARNLACSGATPLGTTDNLNFANPHNPELFWQLQGIGARAGRSLPRVQRSRDRRQLQPLQPKPQRPD